MFKKTGKLLSLLLSMVLVITLGAGNSRVSANELLSNSLQQSVLDKQFSSKAVQESFAAKHNLDTSQYKENNAVRSNLDETVRVVVQLQDKPAIERKGVSVQAVKNGQAKVVSQAKAITGKKVEQTFGYLVNGFSMDAKRGDIPKLKNIDGVSAVTEAVKFLPDLTNAKGLTQVYSEWKDLGYKGEGMVVAILDSGVDSTHKDMRITDPSKDTLTEANVKDKITNLNLTGKDGKFFTNKVPFGYNYADHNLNIVDTNPDTEMHGMHVAGIVAANGTDEEVKNNQAVQGVAPEAQLLAMRVFSNTDKYAYEDTIVAAIDDAALLGVNVINMSLGATAGFQEDNDPEQLAIKNATDAGVVVVVSAGNSYYSTKDFGNLSGYGLYDTGVVGSPSAAKDALSVASYENTNVTLPAFSYTDGTNSGIVGYTTSEVNPLSILKDTNGYQLVDCGVGRPEDFAGKDLKGKIALIQRGTLSFVDKKYNAQTAGAIGAIVYNNSDSGYINMATDPRITIPGIFVSYGDGNKLKGLVASGVKVKFSEGVVTVVPNALAGAMSDFTSWGTNPDLTFKPQITAPGGSIYSTANNNKYQTMSGTSMAAPHTAGSEALIMQALKERTAKGEISFATPRDMVNFAKDTAINTAVPQMDKSRNNTVPYSPRRQGAGLVQIENAINNKVLVKDNTGSTTAALKEIGKQTTFDLNLTNYGTKDVVYNVSTVGGLLRQSSTYGGAAVMPYDVSVSGGSISFDKSSVTVPAGKTAKVTVTLSLPDNLATEQFVEGFVRFTSEDTTVPAIGVPFVGFYGNWGKEQIMDAPTWDSDNTFYGISTVLTEDSKGNDYYLGYTGRDQYGAAVVDPNRIAISPNGDDAYDNVLPYLWMLRNAKQMKVEVLDSQNNVVRTIKTTEGNDTDIRKNYDTTVSTGTLLDQFAWDGRLDNGKAAKEGQYYLRVSAKLDYANSTWQTMVMPVKVDVTKPNLHITSSRATNNSQYTLSWVATDKVTGVENYVTVNGKEIDISKAALTDGKYSITLDLPRGNNSIVIDAVDYAENYSEESIKVFVNPAADKK